MEAFDLLTSILEERKEEVVGVISKHQDDKLQHVQSLIQRHGEHLEVAVGLVESAIQAMEEQHMSQFIQAGGAALCNCTVKTLEVEEE